MQFLKLPALFASLLVGCAPQAMTTDAQHPASPDAPMGRLAGPPAALRPGVADISTPKRGNDDHSGHGAAPQAPAHDHSGHQESPTTDEPATPEPPKTEPTTPTPTPPAKKPRKPEKPPASKKAPETPTPTPTPTPPPAHHGHEGHH